MSELALSPADAGAGLFSLSKETKPEQIPSRVTVRLSEEIQKAVGEIIENTPSQKPSDVFRRALVVYHTLLMQKLAGNEPVVEIKEKDGTKRVPVFF